MEPDEEYRDLLLFLLEETGGDLKTEPVHYGQPLNSFEPLQVPRAGAITANGTQGAMAVRSKGTVARTSQDGGKGRRKRGPTSQQQVQELEKQVAEQTAALQQLSINNVYLSERVHMLEMVIWVRDRQVERIQSIKAGLTFNPFAAMGMSPDEVQGKTPAWMAQKFIANCSIMGQRLAPVMPDLQRYPWLFAGPDPQSEWPRVKCRVGPGGETAPPFHYGGACNNMASMADGPTLQAHNYVVTLVQQQQQQQQEAVSGIKASYGSLGRASTGSSESTLSGTSARTPCQPIPPPLEQLQPTIETLRQMVSRIDELMMGLQFKLFMFPEHSLASSLHVQAVDAGHTDWLALATSVHTSHEAAKAAGLDEGVPSVAPEAHWAQVIARTGLTDMQRMQAALLWEIFSGARSVVWAQRRALGAAMARLQQEPPSAGPTEAALGAGVGSAWDISQGRGAGTLGATAAGPRAAVHEGSGEGAGCMSRGGSGAASSSLAPSTTADSAKSAASSGTWLASTGSGGLGSTSGNGLAGVGVAGATAWKSPETLRQEASILRKLQHTVIKERCLVTLAIETMHLHVLSPVQVAVMCVNSYPFFPDEVALLHAASKEFQSDTFFPKSMQWPGRQASSTMM